MLEFVCFRQLMKEDFSHRQKYIALHRQLPKIVPESLEKILYKAALLVVSRIHPSIFREIVETVQTSVLWVLIYNCQLKVEAI